MLILTMVCILEFLHYFFASQELHECGIIRGALWGIGGILAFLIPFLVIAAPTALALKFVGLTYELHETLYYLAFGLPLICGMVAAHFAARKYLGVREIGEAA